MRHATLAMVLGSVLLLGGASKQPESEVVCTPSYFELSEPVSVSVGVSQLSFRLLAIGCRESLEELWPPSVDKLEAELQVELREPHPVQTLFLIRDRSPELRERVTERLNTVFEKRVVYDVFLFDAKAVEY